MLSDFHPANSRHLLKDAATFAVATRPFRRFAGDCALTAAAVFVARIAIHAVVDIPSDPLVRGVSSCFGMARSVRAREHHIAIRIRVAGGANSVRVTVVDAPPCVTKRCTAPRSRGVARCAVRRKNCRRGAVNRIRCCVVVGLVASDAGRRQGGVVVVYVAVRAGHLRMKSRQRECRFAVVELAVCPLDGVVAQLACRREPELNMVDRSCSSVVVLQVAGGASCTRQVVVVVDVAVRTHSRWNHVRVRECEACRRVVELPVRPTDRVVTAFTSGWKS